ncbi:MAG TPA: dihydrolipoamide acetyltransferase family protein [Steroidobacteraceae bacterium]|jgi:2-oxoisovalerate dehydrogenase E2 component (dihydrolipoyl transacylase)|nr:dihydrolipoamide acetyltransferase family protein [Steroidobacteraceae bacterium]
MSRHVVKLPDLGEGTVSSEIVAWHVKVGDHVAEDQAMVEMSTDKAVVDMPAPVAGRVVSLGGQPGDHIAVGAELIVLETAEGAAATEKSEPAKKEETAAAAPKEKAAGSHLSLVPPPAKPAQPRTGRVLASPATRRRARESGIDLATVVGSGRDGRIQRQDLDAAISNQMKSPGAAARVAGATRQPRTETEEIRILGVRRVSAQRVAESKRNIPHFSYVDEVDITELERLRKHLNSKLPKGAPSYTYLPFLGLALIRVVERFPKCNARYDAERNVLVQHRGVHLGVATQTGDGLKVPVVHHSETLSLSELAAQIRRVAQAARDGTASRSELSGSTITITSLGKLGGIVSTPIINAPEVAIIGVNKAIERPVVQHGQIAVRLMMNLSTSFDHRFIDGYDAAEIVQALKEMLEQPATIFIDR